MSVPAIGSEAQLESERFHLGSWQHREKLPHSHRIGGDGVFNLVKQRRVLLWKMVTIDLFQRERLCLRAA